MEGWRRFGVDEGREKRGNGLRKREGGWMEGWRRGEKDGWRQTMAVLVSTRRTYE